MAKGCAAGFFVETCNVKIGSLGKIGKGETYKKHTKKVQKNLNFGKRGRFGVLKPLKKIVKRCETERKVGR